MATVTLTNPIKKLTIRQVDSYSLAIHVIPAGCEEVSDSIFLRWTPDQLRQLAAKIYELYPPEIKASDSQ